MICTKGEKIMIEESIVETASLSDATRTMVERYLESVGREKVVDLHAMVLEQIEPPLLQAVIAHCKYNQSRAAKVLGMSRGTFRAKLIKYFEDQYCGRREPKDN